MTKLTEILHRHQDKLKSILPPKWQNAKTYAVNLSYDNNEFADIDHNDLDALTERTKALLKQHQAQLAIGRYAENRAIYERSELFSQENRSIHLGLDLMLPPGTKIHAPLNGTVHSFHDNDEFGSYGPAIVLQHELEGTRFHTLYGHLSRASLKQLQIGKSIQAGGPFATIGAPDENGQWPPHLHLQIIIDMQGHHGDYPGVASPKEAEHYLQNCPDPGILFPSGFFT